MFEEEDFYKEFKSAKKAGLWIMATGLIATIAIVGIVIWAVVALISNLL